MAQRRQETPRLLAGRNSANPIEMQADFNLRPSAPQSVSGIQQVNAPNVNIMDTSLQVLSGLAEFGSKKIREAATIRYEKAMLDGAMAYQQGKAVDELEMDGNKWMLEGYRTMEAETVTSALYAAQQAEITNGLYEADPDTFRANYTSRLEAALAGKDERTQELIKRRMAEQMPALVEQHTREHAGYLERRSAEALATSVDVISRDPSNTQALIDFATGASPASQGIGEEKRRNAVVDGVVRAYTNGNPLAFTILDQQGVFENFTPQQIETMRSAAASYESRKRSEYDGAFLEAQETLLMSIEQGKMQPMEAVEAYSKLMTEHGMKMNAAEAGNIYAAGRESGANNARAILYDVETAKLNGDYDKVGELTYQYAQNAANPATPGKVYDYNIPVQYNMGPKRPNKPRNEIVSVIASAAEEVLGTGGKVVITSGTENEGEQHGSNRHKTGNAADVALYREDGTRVKSSDPEMLAIAEAAARRGATGIGFGDEYMGGEHVHIDLVGTTGGGGNVWASGAKANRDTLVATMQSATKGTSLGDVDAEKWKTIVKQFNGDVELAAVAYTMGTDAAKTWDETGRRTADLDPDVAGFVDRIGGQLEGRAYQTAETRVAEAQATYEIARERAAVDVYGQIAPKLADLDRQFVAGQIDEDTYKTNRRGIMAQYQVATTQAEIDHIINMSDQRYANAQKIAQEIAADTKRVLKDTADENYAVNLEKFAAERVVADAGLKAAVEAIKGMTKPAGATDAEFMKAQNDAMALALNTYNSDMAAAAASLGIKPQHSAMSDRVSNIVEATRNGTLYAQENLERNAIAERAILTGTLMSQPADVQELAWKQAQQGIERDVQAFASSPKPDGTMPTPQEIGDFNKEAVEKFFVQSGYVPDNIRREASAVLNGSLVLPDGTVNPVALDTVIAYRDLKAKSSTAAMQMLDDKSRLVAEAALLTAGNNENALARVMQDMWAKGLGNPLSGKPDPKFAERGEVTAAIRDTLGGGRVGRMIGRIFGGQAPVDNMDLRPEDRTVVETMITSQIQKLHELNPYLDPGMAAKVAEESVVRSIAPLDTSFSGTGERQGVFSTIGYYTGNTNGQNRLIVDASGGDLMQQMFGGRADQYSSDRTSIAKAISGYVSSPEFKAKHGDMTPTVGAITYMIESLPFVSDELSTAQSIGKPIFNVHHAGQGKLYFDFTLNEDGVSVPLVIPMEEIGQWYMKQDVRNLTK